MDIPTGFDLTKLRADGSHFIAIGFSLPFCIHLPDDNYPINILDVSNKITIQIVIERKQRNLGKKGLLFGSEEIERFADRRSTYCFTQVICYIPIRSKDQVTNQDFEAMSKIADSNRNWSRSIAIKAINRFIELYRFFSGECHIRPLAGHDVWFDFSSTFMFNELPPNVGKSKFRSYFTPVYQFGDLISQGANIPPVVIHEIKAKSLQDFDVKLSEELITNAYDFLDQGNYRLAIIEIETGFEAILFELLQAHYGGKTRIRNYKSPADLIKASMFQTLMRNQKKVFDKTSPLYKEWNKLVWSKRNDIVHGRLKDVSHDIALQAITVVEKNLEYILDRKQTRPWRYLGC